MSNETLIALLRGNLADLELQLSQLQHRADALRSTISTLQNELNMTQVMNEQASIQADSAMQLASSAMQSAQQAASMAAAGRCELNSFIEHTTNQIEALAEKAQHAVVATSDIQPQEAEIPIVPIEQEPLSDEEEKQIDSDLREAQVEMVEEAANAEHAIEEIEPEPIDEEPIDETEEAEILSDLQQAQAAIAEEPDLHMVSEDEEAQLDVDQNTIDQPDQSSIIPKIDDIKAGISIGDRFLFQRQLFKNNGELMNKTIAKLNTMTSFDEALNYCEKHFEWDKDSNAYELFVNVLRRRY